MRFRSLLPAVAIVLGPAVAMGQQPEPKKTEAKQSKTHVFLTSADLQWTAGPEGLPEGAQMAVLEGDPTKKGPFTVRLRLPANYRVAPHRHGNDEHVTVLEGRIRFGMGDRFDPEKMMDLDPGGFAMMPKGMHHFAEAPEEATIQLHGQGPWTITYVNPADDPRKKRASR
jgi:mannose-6-phosphate isomerase-like protein (cupin superfamily)